MQLKWTEYNKRPFFWLTSPPPCLSKKTTMTCHVKPFFSENRCNAHANGTKTSRIETSIQEEGKGFSLVIVQYHWGAIIQCYISFGAISTYAIDPHWHDRKLISRPPYSKTHWVWDRSSFFDNGELCRSLVLTILFDFMKIM